MATPVVSQVSSAGASSFRKGEVIIVSLICLVLPVLAGIYMYPRGGWITIVLTMVLYFLFLGRWISGRPLGVLVNERNLMSLSRFQLVAWTILLLSAFLSIALKRLHALSSNPAALPLNVSMDWRLWALMGISATSLVGSPLILSTKTTQVPTAKTVDKAAVSLSESPEKIQENSQGTLYSNPHISDASLTDMFQGDEIGNTAYVDVSKVQMFYFTIIAVVTYSYALYTGMTNIYPQKGFMMPVPSDALVALLAISHAAYLTSKATSHA
jgi:hypothetical protein